MADHTGETTIIIEEAHPHPRGRPTPTRTAEHRCLYALDRLERATARLDAALDDEEEHHDAQQQR